MARKRYSDEDALKILRQIGLDLHDELIETLGLCSHYLKYEQSSCCLVLPENSNKDTSFLGLERTYFSLILWSKAIFGISPVPHLHSIQINKMEILIMRSYVALVFQLQNRRVLRLLAGLGQ